MPKTISKFSAKQNKAIELLALADMQYIELAAEVGVSVDTLRRWRKRDDFQAAVVKRCRDLLKESEPLLYNAALQEVKSSRSYQHIRLLLERLERLEDIAEGRSNTEHNVMFTWKESPANDQQEPTEPNQPE